MAGGLHLFSAPSWNGKAASEVGLLHTELKLSRFDVRALQLPICDLKSGTSRLSATAGLSHQNLSRPANHFSRNETSYISEHRREQCASTSRGDMLGVKLLCSSMREAKKFGSFFHCAAAMVGSRSEAPSCIFVGPIETAEKARLEALYQQARDSYYSGQPLIVDDMFDKVETQLRWHGSKLVLKYPRCSLRRFTAYADAELDPSQMRALATIWSMLLTFGVALAAGLPACTLNKACQAVSNMQFESHGVSLMSERVHATNRMLAVVVGFLIGVPVTMAAVKQLQGLWRGDLVALKGCCPNCGEEVYTFVRADQSVKPRHKTECHVCERQLDFHAKIERSNTRLGQPWAYGRVYLVAQVSQLAPGAEQQRQDSEAKQGRD